MNTCDTCKHWQRRVLGDGEVEGDCAHEKLGQFAHRFDDGCGKTDFEPNVHNKTVTGPKFGCVHWESMHPKPARLPYREPTSDIEKYWGKDAAE